VSGNPYAIIAAQGTLAASNYSFVFVNGVLEIQKADSAGVLTSSVNPSVYGQPLLFTAAFAPVAPASGTPSGTATFWNGSTALGTVPLDAAGQAACAAGPLSTTNHIISCVFSGDDNFHGSITPTVTQRVNRAGTVSAMSCTPNPSVYGEPMTLAATVSASAPGSGTPSGTVIFYKKKPGEELGRVTLDATGSATLLVSNLDAATYPKMRVEYMGDACFLSSESGDYRHTVNKATTATTVDSSANPAVYGQSVVFTATVVVVAPGSGIPAGTATFSIDGAPQATVALDSEGRATFATSALAVGNHAVTAAYGGANNFLSSSGSLPGGQTVEPAASLTALASSANPSRYNQPLTLTATVSAAPPGSGTPTGIVTFVDGAVTLGAADLNPAGVASFTVAAGQLAVGGEHSLTAVYGGDSRFGASASPPLLQAVEPGILTVTAAAANKVYDGTTTATVTLSDDRLPGDVLTVTHTQAAFVDQNAGPAKLVNVAGLSLAGSDAGKYLLAATAATAVADIAKAPLTVAANPAARAYGQPNPPFAASYSGFVHGEDLASSGVTGSPLLSTAAHETSPLGSYAITVEQGSLSADNYTFQFQHGTLQVTPGPPAKLQVLLPGETAAPATPSGKSGVPTQRTIAEPFAIVINAVDAYWHVVDVSHVVRLSSTDPAAVLPTEVPLTNGTAIVAGVVLNSPGEHVIEASDLTDPNLIPGLSAIVPLTAVLAVSDAFAPTGHGQPAAAVFAVSLSSPMADDVSVVFSTADGTAAAGVDYVATQGTLVIPAGQTNATVSVPILPRAPGEGGGTFLLNLSNPLKALLGDGEGVGTIIDESAPVNATVADIAVTEGDVGAQEAVFTVTLSRVSSWEITVAYVTSAETATADADFLPVSGTLQIPAGGAAGEIRVPVLGDLMSDNRPETFRLLLSNPVHVVLSRSEAVCTILDNERMLCTVFSFK